MTQYTAQVMDADAFLEHYGVKGMKWGHHKATTAQIHDARRRQDSRSRNLQKVEDKILAKEGTTGKKAKAERKQYDKLSKEFLNSPDRVTAMRLTKGEKYANVALAVLFPVAGTAAVAGVGVARAGARRKIAKNQRKGTYNNKNYGDKV